MRHAGAQCNGTDTEVGACSPPPLGQYVTAICFWGHAFATCRYTHALLLVALSDSSWILIYEA
jgi:hypothetical protein